MINDLNKDCLNEGNDEEDEPRQALLLFLFLFLFNMLFISAGLQFARYFKEERRKKAPGQVGSDLQIEKMMGQRRRKQSVGNFVGQNVRI